jgi:hypothetical protein
MIICYALISVTYAADSFVVTESSIDRLELDKETGDYMVVTSGKYSITAKITNSTLKHAGVFISDFTEDTTFSIGPYDTFIDGGEFYAHLSDATSWKLTSSQITAKWFLQECSLDMPGYVSACVVPEWDYTKIKPGIMSLTGNLSGLNFKIDGTSYTEPDLTEGIRSIYSDECDRTKVMNHELYIQNEGNYPIFKMRVTCTVKSTIKTPINGGESYELFTKTIKAINTGKTAYEYERPYPEDSITCLGMTESGFACDGSGSIKSTGSTGSKVTPPKSLSEIIGTWKITDPIGLSGKTFTVGSDGKISVFYASFATPYGGCFSNAAGTFSNMTLDQNNYKVSGSDYSAATYKNNGLWHNISISGTFTSAKTFEGLYDASTGVTNSFGICKSTGTGLFKAIKQ